VKATWEQPPAIGGLQSKLNGDFRDKIIKLPPQSVTIISVMLPIKNYRFRVARGHFRATAVGTWTDGEDEVLRQNNETV
jgi:hypothetical protein